MSGGNTSQKDCPKSAQEEWRWIIQQSFVWQSKRELRAMLMVRVKKQKDSQTNRKLALNEAMKLTSFLEC
ncbi:hypothetical protein FRX31_016412 [Thalictrum thalictroides]|uniref:Uncharacterized protein n=1 Tax=Thalictrum thalictroides TaxID=46969 RepID=A0A7J6WCR8_THATH|nr:hypothetical protein FRX31_016412 [Thalictrum thalictroides]